jgi:hypothetical protein
MAPVDHMLPTSQEIAESALDLDEAMPLKSDSTARREPMMAAKVKAASVAAAIRRRLTIKTIWSLGHGTPRDVPRCPQEKWV